MKEPETKLTLHLMMLEYFTLKSEQRQRMDYRDHMVHVHLGLVGAAMAWAFTENPEACLVVPWVCFVIGWAYVLNPDNSVRHESTEDQRMRDPPE